MFGRVNKFMLSHENMHMKLWWMIMRARHSFVSHHAENVAHAQRTFIVAATATLLLYSAAELASSRLRTHKIS